MVKCKATYETIVADLEVEEHNLHDHFSKNDPSYARIMAKRGTPSDILDIKNKPKAVEIAKFIVKTYLHMIISDIVKDGYTFAYFAGRFNVIRTRHDITKTNRNRHKNIIGIKKLRLNSSWIFHFLPRELTKRYLKGFYYYTVLLGEHKKMFKKEIENGNRY